MVMGKEGVSCHIRLIVNYEYHGLLGLDPLLNRPDACAGPLLSPPHEAAQSSPLY